jgi:hypothetical protein
MSQLDEIWRKSVRSMDNGNCVELRVVGDHVQIRDSKNPGSYLTFERAQFSKFLAAVINREYDIP